MTETVTVLVPPNRQPEAETRRRRKAFWRKLLFGILVSLVLIIIGAIATFVVATGMPLSQLPRVFTAGWSIMGNQLRPAPPFGGRAHVVIMLLGADVAFDGSEDARTDTIKLLYADLVNPRLTLISIPRDTWVNIPGHKEARINSAYQLGGSTEEARLQLTRETITGLLSTYSDAPMVIDHYIRVQTGGFTKIIDALGGVEIEVEKKMDYDDPSQDLHIHLKPGLQHLSGEQAMGYVRFRHDAESDFGRIRRQDQFVRAMVAKLRDPNEKNRLPHLLGPIMEMMVTDISASDLLALKRLADQVGMNGIHALTLPTAPVRKGAADVLEVSDPAEAALIVGEFLHGPRPTVTVLNASRRKDAGRVYSRMLEPHLYNVQYVGTTQVSGASQVFADPRRKGEAESVAAILGIATVHVDMPPPPAVIHKNGKIPPPADITVVIGNETDAPPSMPATTTPIARDAS